MVPFILLSIITVIVITLSLKSMRGDTLDELERALSGFNITRKHRDSGNEWEIAVDASQRKFCHMVASTKKSTIFLYDEVISAELDVDGVSVSSRSVMGTIGRAALGGMIAGVGGAIVGGITSKNTIVNGFKNLSVRVHMRNMETPVLELPIVKNMSVSGNSATVFMKMAHSCMDIFSVIVDDVERGRYDNECDSLRKDNQPKRPYSIADEIAKYHELKNRGVISENEFLTLKEKLLS